MTNQDYKNAALNALSGNWAPALILMLVIIVVEAVIGGYQGYQLIAYYPNPAPSGFGDILSSLASLLVIAPLGVGVCNAFKDLVKSGDNNLLENSFKQGFVQGYGRNLLTMLLIGIFVTLWTFLLIIPGIIMAYAYSMAPYIIKDHPELSPMEAIKASRAMMKGHKFDLFYLHLSFIGWMLLTVLTCGIGFLWLAPYMESAQAAFYLDIKGDSDVIYAERVL
ncbi:MAG: DUF975 family protein [Bacteroidales bacterium]|nr:DUF975 family protein [Bacteroidales bacterium]